MNTAEFCFSPSDAFIALGANIENPLHQIDNALLKIDSHSKIKCIKLSKIYKSIPHGDIEQPDFINAVLHVKTTVAPEDLLEFLLRIEQEMGRKRLVRWGPRIIDLDLIAYNDLIITSDSLTLPHPLASEREFVIMPMLDLVESFVIPNKGTVAQLSKSFLNHKMQVIRDAKKY